MAKRKITTIVGTRPEIIRLSTTIRKFDFVFDHRLIHTGQNYSTNLRDIFIDELNLREPDIQFQLTQSSLGASLGEILTFVEKDLIENRPDAVVILGDTNSALSAIIAKRMRIPVYHLEAGNRSFDLNVPEEINRKIVDHTADFNLVYTEHARRNLLSEGMHPRNICLIGSPLREVLNENDSKIENSRILEILNLKENEYFLLSLHRQENIDNQERLSSLVKILNEVADEFQIPMVLSVHPRTADKLRESKESLHNNIKQIDAFGFHDYCKLQKHSKLTISDSGSVSEEAAILGFKALTLRDSMERPEALESGNVIMAGINSGSIVDAINFKLHNAEVPTTPSEYLINDSSVRVINFIFSTLGNYHFWQGIRE